MVELDVDRLVILVEGFLLAEELILAGGVDGGRAFLVEGDGACYLRLETCRCPLIGHESIAVVAEFGAIHEEEVGLASLHAERIAGVSLGDDRIAE